MGDVCTPSTDDRRQCAPPSASRRDRDVGAPGPWAAQRSAALWPLWPQTPGALLGQKRHSGALGVPGDCSAGGHYCLGFGGASIDKQISEQVLETIRPLT